MCNLYNISTNREAITKLTRALDHGGGMTRQGHRYGMLDTVMLAPIVPVGADTVARCLGGKALSPP